jgi:hypothetical protein
MTTLEQLQESLRGLSSGDVSQTCVAPF